MIKIPIITGATASGKSSFGIMLSETFNIEIISADAFQIYKLMDIGTAKPSKEELSKVKHHLTDEIYPDKHYSSGIFFTRGEEIIQDTINRGKLPVIVGGTGMYVESIVKGIFKGPERDEAFRKELSDKIERDGTEYYYNELKKIDPDYTSKITSSDRNKIIRGLEIISLTKLTVSEAHVRYHQQPRFNYDVYVFEKDREKIYKDIDSRVIKMFDSGWCGEVENLLQQGYGIELDSFKAIGYREIANALVNGKDPFSEIAIIQQKTRNFAKRQGTWFRHMKGINYIRSDEDADKLFSGLKNMYEFYLK